MNQLSDLVTACQEAKWIPSIMMSSTDIVFCNNEYIVNDHKSIASQCIDIINLITVPSFKKESLASKLGYPGGAVFRFDPSIYNDANKDDKLIKDIQNAAYQHGTSLIVTENKDNKTL